MTLDETSKTAGISLDPATCPVRQVLDGVSDKWSILVMAALHVTPRRFSELRRDIPDVSQKVLTQTLRKLERNGLVDRKVTPTAPPRVDYSLQPLGQSLFARFSPLAAWAIENRAEIDAARSAYDARS
ncbi:MULTISPECIES: winged helix-turn-helix transcriptional regulator [Roseicyclus]|uniref:winged helix-turn-helix transcriptional regulator n=1 Tax=Roseicyclus amphidinii TaxID=3034232 RepID=UPI0024E14F96|nr:helix-turn-helix domain-containing protein [Roseicyclus sp. Amp-Y-6]